MPNSNQRKGRAAELAVAAWLRDHGFPYCEPTRRSGWADDRGDIDGIPGVTIEVKNEKVIRLAAYHRELIAEIENGGTDTGVCIVKQRGTTDVGEWYATMPVWLYVELLKGYLMLDDAA